MGNAQMRHVLLQRTARIIDQLIEAHRRARKRRNFPHKEVWGIVNLLFPGSAHSGRGAHKTVFVVRSRVKSLALKTSNSDKIMNDWLAYHSLPKNIRNRYFAKIYWLTDHCLLQKYGKESQVPEKVLQKLKEIGKKYGLRDIRPANIRKVDGRFKIVDASLSG